MPRVSIAAKYVNMADINSDRDLADREPRSAAADRTAGAQSFPDDPLIAYVELLFFAYRDFTGEPDALLDDFGFGRAHHRVLHFVHRNPGLRVADLLDILKITKQSLARVLKHLIDDEFIQQEAGVEDRRERRLYLTERGRSLACRLVKLQTERIEAALGAAGPGAKDAVAKFLLAVVSPEDRATVSKIVARRTTGTTP